MGLDMYLYLEEYKSKLPSAGESTLNFYPPELNEIQKAQEKRNFLSKMTKYQVGYWRKVNCVHQFFVDNCADGVDDCRPMYVSLEVLELLKKKCEEALDNKDNASEILPCQEGFFFGSQEYDDYYFEDLEYTLSIITPIIEFLKTKHNASWSCYYEASW